MGLQRVDIFCVIFRSLLYFEWKVVLILAEIVTITFSISTMESIPISIRMIAVIRHARGGWPCYGAYWALATAICSDLPSVATLGSSGARRNLAAYKICSGLICNGLLLILVGN